MIIKVLQKTGQTLKRFQTAQHTTTMLTLSALDATPEISILPLKENGRPLVSRNLSTTSENSTSIITYQPQELKEKLRHVKDILPIMLGTPICWKPLNSVLLTNTRKS